MTQRNIPGPGPAPRTTGSAITRLLDLINGADLEQQRVVIERPHSYDVIPAVSRRHTTTGQLAAISARRRSDPLADRSRFGTAILGAGASAAYYLATEGGQLDRQDTVIIGRRQPWAGERGRSGVINHPLNMIDFRFSGAQLSDPEGGLALREKFSELVDEVLDTWPNHREEEIVRVSLDPSGDYYQVTTALGGQYSARRLIVALGVGQHLLPPNITWAGQDSAQPANRTGTGGKLPKIMDMDTFQRAVESGEFPPRTIQSVALIGPNAAIDVMTTLIRTHDRLGVQQVHWITGSQKPKFLPGTDNVYAQKAYEEIQTKGERRGDDRIRGKLFLTASPSQASVTHVVKIDVVRYDYLAAAVSGNGVTLTYGERAPRRKPGEAAVPEKRVGELTVDLTVYGVGPDVKGLAKIVGLDPTNLATQLQPVYDVGQHFNYAGGIESKAQLTEYLRSFGGRRAARQVDQIVAILGEIETLERPPDQEVPRYLPSVVGLRKKQEGRASLEFVGATAFRLALESKVNYGYLSASLARFEAEELFSIRRLLTAGGMHSQFPGRATSFARALGRYLEDAKALASILEGIREAGEGEKQKGALEAVEGLWTRVGQRLKDATDAPDADRYPELLGRMLGARSLASSYQLQLRELYQNVVAAKEGVTAAGQMSAIAHTLPQNVVLGDQLTAARSAVEALQAFLPSSVGEGVSFVSSNHTTIAAHVAARYGAIPPRLADYITAQIVYERRHASPETAPLPRSTKEQNPHAAFAIDRQTAFQQRWIEKLAAIDRLFATLR